jgi:hypothetical protein
MILKFRKMNVKIFLLVLFIKKIFDAFSPHYLDQIHQTFHNSKNSFFSKKKGLEGVIFRIKNVN